ncbi:5-demethoxyubiquinol-8 5-hydroxylase UbiM [Candidatus Vesicomyidisocius sp. SY067_SCS001]|uniref:5-demethoxyubiquinol-8 5-hydroxylase UbiM n=1 Tax=Candidatus Vesicomyidisocius sp. SY067_SCS001 TaxID=2732590 RepID=UPI0016822DF0|nr:5-demethoxyubiquinol-8 5-hydroxylase UbiM [Candidatus Vesicomyosocius sp. SY067_SCS001]
MKVDIVIIGGGPVGLSFASAMLNSNIKILLIERSSLDSIASPQVDGREIALTHLSLKILKKLGVWDLINQAEVSPLKEAKVFDGDSPSLLNFTTKNTSIEALGYLVPNYQIRKALYTKVKQKKKIDIITNMVVEDVIQLDECSQVILSNGDKIETKLVIAADSRFSDIRRKVGIPTLMKDFSKLMIVTQMSHELSHNNVALERFDYGRTLALLPMVGNISSIVLTVKINQSKAILEMNETDFNHMITQSFKYELGQMIQIGERYSYPLIATHAQTFISKRFALIGDASVSMHPLTAHGFNLGLRGQAILAKLVNEALDNGQDIGSKSLLKLYEKKHINLTRLMFFSTNSIVALFTNDAPLIKQIRSFVLKFAEHFPPIKYLIFNHLTQDKKYKSFHF